MWDISESIYIKNNISVSQGYINFLRKHGQRQYHNLTRQTTTMWQLQITIKIFLNVLQHNIYITNK